MDASGPACTATIKRKPSAPRKLLSYLLETGILVGNPAQEVATEEVKMQIENARLPPVISNHSFRATGITEILPSGGILETAQQLANHADSRTTMIFDRRSTKLELEEIVRIRY